MAERQFLEPVIEKPVDEPAAPPPVEKPAPESKEAAPAEKPAAEASAAKPEPEKDPKEAAYWRGLADEREKRRKATEEAAYWRGRAEAQAQPDDAKKAQKDREDAFLTDPVNFTEQMIQQRLEAAVLQDRWARSIDAVESEHKDWAEKRDKFLKMAAEDPTLEARVNAHPNPARYAYEFVRQHEAVGAPLDVEAEKKRIRAEVEADVRKEMALSAAGSTPPTLAGATGAGGSGSAGQVPDVNDLFVNKSF